ncbi:MAG: sigma-54 dependent transcriptional regulator [Planctomycetaceae bacterium]|nr:sigma-54 dependent transcriptional regulator [Planctomycetaceae bacterium]
MKTIPAENTQLVGNSEAMQNIQRLIDRIAATDSTVVILGETGTGKELVAKAVHDRSARKDKPFVAVNCGALPETLIESELFGHCKGSFTGADTNRTGLLEVADGGTLFLDEIGELPKGVQAKLLRFLECGEVRKIGENKAAICDVRVVCATLQNLESMVGRGDFREDLWFRINTFEICLPNLRERKEDLPQLILYLSKRFSQTHPAIQEAADISQLFTKEAINWLLSYDYPGNVRQLSNTLEHSLILSEKLPVNESMLPEALRPRVRIHSESPAAENGEGVDNDDKWTVRPTINKYHVNAADDEVFDSEDKPRCFPAITPVQTLRELEMQAICMSLERHAGNKVKAAEELGISLKTLYNKLNRADGKCTA